MFCIVDGWMVGRIEEGKWQKKRTHIKSEEESRLKEGGVNGARMKEGEIYDEGRVYSIR